MDKPQYDYEALKEGLNKIDINVKRIEEAVEKAQENIATMNVAIREEQFKGVEGELAVINRAEKSIKNSEDEIETFRTEISSLNEQKFDLMFYVKEHERYEKRKDNG